MSARSFLIIITYRSMSRNAEFITTVLRMAPDLLPCRRAPYTKDTLNDKRPACQVSCHIALWWHSGIFSHSYTCVWVPSGFYALRHTVTAIALSLHCNTAVMFRVIVLLAMNVTSGTVHTLCSSTRHTVWRWTPRHAVQGSWSRMRRTLLALPERSKSLE